MNKNWLPIAVAAILPVIIVGAIIVLNPGTTDNGKPKIWFCDRVLVTEDENVSIPENVLRSFLNPDANLETLGKPVEPVPVDYSCRADVGKCHHGGKVCFEHAVEGDGWIIEWGMKYCDTGESVESNCSAPVACGVYFTGIGCPHCAVADPWLFYEFVPTHPLVIVEYEIYRDGAANTRVLEKYIEEYGARPGVPQIIFDRENVIAGDVPILRELENTFKDLNGTCPVDWLRDVMPKSK